MARRTGIILSYINTGLSMVIGILMSSFIIQSVGQTDYGIYQTVTAFAHYLVLFEMGTGTIINRNISLCKKDGSEDDIIQKNISTLWFVTVALSIIITIASFVFFCFMDDIYHTSMTSSQIAYGKPLFWLTIVKLVFGFLLQTLNGTLIGFEHYSFSKIINIVQLIIRTVLVVVFLLLYHSVYVVVIIDTVLSVVSVLVTLFYCRKKHPFKFSLRFFDKSVFLNAMPLALALLLQTVINMANNNVDKFVISITMTPDHVAIYAVAMHIFTTFSSLMTVPITMYMPQVAQNIRAGKQGMALTETMIQPNRLAVMVGGIAMFGFISIGRPFIKMMYGVEYMEAWVICVLVMIPTFIYMTPCVMANVLDVLNKRHIRSLILMSTTVLNILLTIWLVNVRGMIGAAIATAVALVIGQIIVMNTYYAKKIGIKILYLYAQSYKGVILCLVFACLVGWSVTIPFKNAWLQCMTGGLAFVVVFAITYICFGANQTEKKALLRKLRS